MKEQLKSVILPKLPIVGNLKLSSRDGKSLCLIEVVSGKPSKEIDPFFQECFNEFESYLSGKSRKINLKLDLKGLTPFQLEVMNAMKEIKFGTVATYKDLAQRMESRAFQAIGSACGRNPLMLIYPCHRVLGSKDIGGFAHGIEMKKKLLELEEIIF
jgi:O-6-methylguanine DNA methyltransferase